MTKDWIFDQNLDDKTPTSSTEERAKIAALFQKPQNQSKDDLDYVAAFEMEQKKSKENSNSGVATKVQVSKVKNNEPTITKDYKHYLEDEITRHSKEILESQKKIEGLHQLIDDKNKMIKKLKAIAVAIDEL